MRRSFIALATAALLLGACGETPKTSTPRAQPVTVQSAAGSPLTASGKVKFKHAGLRHCLQQKGTDRKKKLVKTGIMDERDAQRVRRLLSGG